MVTKSWPPRKNNDDSTTSFNNSFNNSLNNSTTGFASPRKFMSPSNKPKRTVPKDEDFANSPRFALFEQKAEIKYVPELDNEAARVYGDRPAVQAKPKIERDKSGYNFDALLKDVDVSYHPWG